MALSIRTAALAIVLVFAAFLYAVSVASAFVCFALTVATAVAWCFWLERHPDAPGADERLAR
jgi:uncharacterized iron-regulated membrane protein